MRTIKQCMRRQQQPDDIPPDTTLFSGGLRLDSLQIAELSITLEDEFGRDPFTAGRAPQTVAEIVEFYNVLP